MSDGDAGILRIARKVDGWMKSRLNRHFLVFIVSATVDIVLMSVCWPEADSSF